MWLIFLAVIFSVLFLSILIESIRNVLLYFKLKRSLPKSRSIPWLPIVGSYALYKEDLSSTGILTTFDRLVMKYGDGFLLQGLMNEPSVYVSTPDVAEQVLSTPGNHKAKLYDFIAPLCSTGILTAYGTRFAEKRKMVARAFSYRMLEIFCGVFKSQFIHLREKIQSNIGKGDFDVHDAIWWYALDVIAETAMGVKLGCQKDHSLPYAKALEELMHIFARRIYNPLNQYELIFRLRKMYRRQNVVAKYVHDFSDGVIKQRKEKLLDLMRDQPAGDDHCKTLLDHLLTAKERGQYLTDKEIRDEVNTFMLGGHDTTASTASFAVYELSQNADIQQRVYDELMEVFGHDLKKLPLNVSNLLKLKYMDMVIKETLRMYTAIPLIGRKATGDLMIDQLVIPKGTSVMVMVQTMHLDPRLFPEPKRFDPERFTEEAISKRHPYSYLPFGAAPRLCVGQKYAMVELKLLLTLLLAKFKFLPCDSGNRVQVEVSLTLTTKTGVNVKVESR
ncbi:cytochrome P450 4d2-like [Uranotaenia lowii]|uniref:cytochrome P450 4d2-like n=1 Tax=Uranotaenia lowii TaxID=190385 RepID=UPI00247B1FF9|nr:cytochrome P450 4d2-like [Uranotaenia lowii]